MLSLNSAISTVIVMVMLGWALAVDAEVLELGESQLHGKKDQPEAMTFVSRAPLDVSETASEWKPVYKIRQEVSRDLFKMAVND